MASTALRGRRETSAARFACAAILCGLTAACASSHGTSGASRHGVAASPRIVADGTEVPTGGGRYHVGKPYKIAGKTYVPKEDPNYEAVGRASWYGSGFHGRRTANGEVFDMHDLSAAHPTLPLPSYVRVTNLDNQRSVVVRVNDRGPFGHGRVLDVSKRTAEMLGFIRAGSAKVHIEYIDKAPLDGRDDERLLATYRVPGNRPADRKGAAEIAFAAPVADAAADAARLAALASPEVETRTAAEPASSTGPADGAARETPVGAGDAPLAVDAPAAPRAKIASKASYAPDRSVRGVSSAIEAVAR